MRRDSDTVTVPDPKPTMQPLEQQKDAPATTDRGDVIVAMDALRQLSTAADLASAETPTAVKAAPTPAPMPLTPRSETARRWSTAAVPFPWGDAKPADRDGRPLPAPLSVGGLDAIYGAPPPPPPPPPSGGLLYSTYPPTSTIFRSAPPSLGALPTGAPGSSLSEYMRLRSLAAFDPLPSPLGRPPAAAGGLLPGLPTGKSEPLDGMSPVAVAADLLNLRRPSLPSLAVPNEPSSTRPLASPAAAVVPSTPRREYDIDARVSDRGHARTLTPTILCLSRRSMSCSSTPGVAGALAGTAGSGKETRPQSAENRRLVHNVSERRRRNSIKLGFAALRTLIPLSQREKHSKVDLLNRSTF